jgi:DNA-binding transcriptional LysR family regulator
LKVCGGHESNALMRLRHIEVFHAVMQAGTVSGAAQVLHISQPAVTKVLQHAEAQLGISLFQRNKGKFKPTPEAQRLFVEVDRLHGDLLAIRRLATSLKSGESQSVRLAATPALGLTVVPAAMARWHKAIKGVRCQLSTHHTRELVNALLLGEADMAVSLQDPRHPGIHTEILASGPMAALTPAKSALARVAGPLHIKDLPSDVIGLEGDDPLGNRVLAELEAQGLKSPALQSRITVQTYQLARALAEAGLGTTLVDPFTAATANPQSVRVRLLEPVLVVPLFLLHAQAAPLSQAARRLVADLREAAVACLAPLSHADV